MTEKKDGKPKDDGKEMPDPRYTRRHDRKKERRV